MERKRKLVVIEEKSLRTSTVKQTSMDRKKKERLLPRMMGATFAERHDFRGKSRAKVGRSHR